MDDIPTAQEGSLAELLNRVGIELARAAHSVDELHVLVACVRPEALQKESIIEKIQAIDLLQQNLGALSSFMFALSGRVPTTWGVGREAADDVKLSQLRERLVRTGDASDEAEPNGGDLWVF